MEVKVIKCLSMWQATK